MARQSGPGPTIDAEPAAEEFFFGPFRVVPSARLLERDGRPTALGGRAFDLLCTLVGRSGEVVGKGELMASTWHGVTVDEGSLRFHMTQLRRALGEGQDGEPYIANVPGRGYCFVAPVGRSAAPKKPDPGSRPQNPGVPPRPSRIIGRDRDIAALTVQLLKHRFVTIRGPGGIGKTTLAVVLAHELKNRFRDGIRFLDLGSLNDPGLVASTAASALGLFVPVGDPTPRLIESLRDQQVLLVLDNCEHLVEAVARLCEQIYQHAPDVCLLATSRESIEVGGEFVFELAPLEIPPDNFGGEAELIRYSSTRLFMEHAAAAGCSTPLADMDAEVVAHICRRLDGIPLAIELVASRLAAHGLIEIHELIEGRLRLALRGRRTAPLRHQSLSAALDWSYELISPGEQALLASLSVFPGPFTLRGVQTVAGNLEPHVVLDRLERLVAKSLVSSRSRASPTSFRLLETTRAYATEKLAASGEVNAVARRHAEYVLRALTPRTYEPGGEQPGGWTHRAELLSDARAALAWASSEVVDPDFQISLTAVCARLFVELNLLEECRVSAARALAIPENVTKDQTARVELIWAFGHAAMYSERISQECEVALKRGLELAQQVGDLKNQFRLLRGLHTLYRRTGERRRLLEVALCAEAVAIDICDPAALARAHAYLGVAYHLSGDQRLAREHLRAAEAGDAAIPVLPVDHFTSPRGPHIISGTNLWLLGFPDQAVGVANDLLGSRSNPDPIMHCAGLCFAARVYRWVGDMNALEEAVDRLNDHSRKHGFGPFHTASLALKGELHVARGAVDEGVELLRQSLPRMFADRLELYSGAAAIALVEGLAAQGRLVDALTSIQARIEAVIAQGDSGEMPELLRVRGELRSHNGDRTGAEQDLLAAIDLAERQSALSWKLRAAISRMRLARNPEAATIAVSELRHTYEQFGEGFDTADLRAARSLLGLA